MRKLPVPSQNNQLKQQQDVEYVLVSDEEGEQGKTLQEYIHITKRRKWVFIAPLLIILPFVIVTLVIKAPVYEATVALLIQTTEPKILSIEQVLTLGASRDFQSTQLEILKSRDIAERVVDALQLQQRAPAKVSSLGQAINAIKRFSHRTLDAVVRPLESVLNRGPAPTASLGTPSSHPDDPAAQRRQAAIARLQNALEVELRQGTALVDVKLRGRDPADLAQQINAVAETYVRRNLEHKLDASRQALLWLRKEASTLKAKIDESELALQEFAEGENFRSPYSFKEKQSFLIQEIQNIQTSYMENRRNRDTLYININELENIFQTNMRDIEGIDSSIINNSLIESLRSKQNALQIRYSNLLNKYKPKHRIMTGLRAEIQRTENSINSELQNNIRKLKVKRSVLLSLENIFKKLLDLKQKELDDLNINVTKYNELQHNIQIDKDLYQSLSKRIAETALTKTLKTNNIQILERAIVPNAPVPTSMPTRLMLGVFVSLGLGLGLALLTEHLDRAFKSTAEAEHYLNIPFLGCIPYYRVKKNQLVTLHQPWSDVSEAYRTLRTWVQTLAPQPGDTWLITSAIPNEGKSTTAVNLAVVCAQLGGTVLVMDADLRRPKVDRILNVPNHHGLTDILARGAAWEAVLQDTAMENLKVLSAGNPPLNPTELLSTKRLNILLAQLQKAFDIIIIDAPIGLSIPDVAILAPTMNRVLLVHHPGACDKDAVLETKKVLERAGANLVGIVFNKLNSKELQYYHSAQKYYHHYTASTHSNAASMPVQRRDMGVSFVDMRPTLDQDTWVVDTHESGGKDDRRSC